MNNNISKPTSSVSSITLKQQAVKDSQRLGNEINNMLEPANGIQTGTYANPMLIIASELESLRVIMFQVLGVMNINELSNTQTQYEIIQSNLQSMLTMAHQSYQQSMSAADQEIVSAFANFISCVAGLAVSAYSYNKSKSLYKEQDIFEGLTTSLSKSIGDSLDGKSISTVADVLKNDQKLMQETQADQEVSIKKLDQATEEFKKMQLHNEAGFDPKKTNQKIEAELEKYIGDPGQDNCILQRKENKNFYNRARKVIQNTTSKIGANLGLEVRVTHEGTELTDTFKNEIKLDLEKPKDFDAHSKFTMMDNAGKKWNIDLNDKSTMYQWKDLTSGNYECKKIITGGPIETFEFNVTASVNGKMLDLTKSEGTHSFTEVNKDNKAYLNYKYTPHDPNEMIEHIEIESNHPDAERFKQLEQNHSLGDGYPQKVLTHITSDYYLSQHSDLLSADLSDPEYKKTVTDYTKKVLRRAALEKFNASLENDLINPNSGKFRRLNDFINTINQMCQSLSQTLSNSPIAKIIEANSQQQQALATYYNNLLNAISSTNSAREQSAQSIVSNISGNLNSIMQMLTDFIQQTGNLEVSVSQGAR